MPPSNARTQSPGMTPRLFPDWLEAAAIADRSFPPRFPSLTGWVVGRFPNACRGSAGAATPWLRHGPLRKLAKNVSKPGERSHAETSNLANELCRCGRLGTDRGHALGARRAGEGSRADQ